MSDLERLSGAAARERVRHWLERLRIPLVCSEDPKNPRAPLTVTERLTGKSIRFALDAVTEVEEAANAENGSLYVRLVLDDGRRFALAQAGIVFAPSFTATGPVPDCPETACFLDFQKLHRHLEHLARDDHQEHQREALQVLMTLLAFLEGARTVGIDVTDEERELDEILEKLEKK